MNCFGLLIQPDEKDAEAAEILVDGAIGSHAYRFLLDTGAAMSRVVCDSYTSTFDSTTTRETGGAFSTAKYDLIVVPHFTLGPISARNFTMARMTEGGKTNLIGMDVLKGHAFHFYFDKSRVEVDSEPPDNCIYQDLTLGKKFHPYVDIHFEGLKAKAIWDSGAGITAVDTAFIAEHGQFFQEAGLSEGTDSTGTAMQTPMFIMAAPAIGNRAFAPCKVAAVNLRHINTNSEIHADLILGYNVLRQANWFFNFPQKKWAIF